VLRVSYGIHDDIRPGVPQPTEWQRIGNQIKAAMIFAFRAPWADARTWLEPHQILVSLCKALFLDDAGNIFLQRGNENNYYDNYQFVGDFDL